MDGLPEPCISHVLSFTSPRDACRLSCVSSSFRSAANSDSLWGSFLPPDCLSLLSLSSPPPPPSFPSKKLLFLSLSRQPLLLDIDGALLSFWLHQPSSCCGAKCFMLSPRSMNIVWGDTPRYWRWTLVPGGRFGEVAELVDVCWLEIRGCIATRLLSPSTLYSAFLVFRLTSAAHGFQQRPVQVSLGIAGDVPHTPRLVCLDPNPPQQPIFPIPAAHNLDDLQCPNRRPDGWFEIELGDFFNQGIDGNDQELEMVVSYVNEGHWKRGLLIQGFEIRPK